MPLTFDESPGVVTFDEAPPKVASTTSSKTKSALEQLNTIEPAVAPIKEEKPSLLDKFRSGVATVGKIAEGMATLPMATISGLTDKVLNPESDFESNVSKWNEKYSSPSSDLTQEYLQKVAPALDALNAVMPNMQLMHQVTRPAILKAPQVEIPPIDPLKAKLDAAAKAKETPQPAPAVVGEQPLPEIKDAPPVIPQEMEHQVPQSEQPLPVLPDQLKPLSEQYPVGTPIGQIEGGVLPDTTPLDPRISIERGLLSTTEELPQSVPDTERLATRHDISDATMDFPLRQDILQSPENQALVEGAIKGEISPQDFGNQMSQLGIDKPQDALGLQPLYESGGETKLPIQRTGKGAFRQGGSVDPKVFLEGLEKVLGFIPKSLEAAKYALGDKLSSAMDRRDTLSIFGLKDKLATIDKLQNPNAGKFGQGGAVNWDTITSFFPSFKDSKYQEPMYHGTSKDVDFKQFKDSKRGIWISPEPAWASTYAVDNDSINFKYNHSTRKYERTNTASRVHQVYVNIKNPYELTPEERSQYQKTNNYAQFQKQITEKAKRLGHDAIIWDKNSIAVFSKDQIKSAISPLGGTGKKGFRQGGAFTPFSSSKKIPTFEEFQRKYSEYSEDVQRQVYEQEFGAKAKGEVIQNIPGFKWELKKTQDVADALFSTKTMSDINDATTGKMYAEAKDLGYTREIANEVSNKLSTPGDMSPLAKSFYENYYKPLMDGARKTYAEIKGIDPEAPILKLYQPRISADKGFWNQFFSGLTSSYGGGFSFGNKPGALKARSVFKAVAPDGHEFIVSQGKDRLLTAWEDKNASLLPYDVKAIKVGDTLPDGTKIIDATQKEIETHTNKKYIQDPLFVGMLKKQQLDRYLAQQKILEEIKKSPIWETHASRVEENNPNHVQLKYGDRIPTLNQYKFDPELAHIFDDFLKSKYDSATGWQMIGAFNNLAIKSFMLLPIKHINNEFVHLVVADGLTGAIPDAAKLKSLAQGTTDALTFSPFYQEVARQGGSLLYPRTVVDGLVEKNMQNLIVQAKNDSKFVETLQSYGLKPVDFFNAWSKASSHSMWLARDAMYMSLIRDKVANGMSIRDAIIKTDQYMPNYRIPTRVLGSRTLSEVMQNPSMTAFSAYHHGALKAMGTTLKKSLIPEDGMGITPQRIEGLNHLAAYTVMMAVIYPMLDKAYQLAAGTPENTPENLKPKMRRAGGFSYIERGEQALESKDPRALYNETLTPAPSMALLQAFPGINTDSFTRKEIYNYKDPLPLQVIDTAKWLGMKEFNAAGSMSIVRETKRGVSLEDAMKHWATDQLLDVKTPDPKAEQYKKVLDVQEQQKANKNFNKRNSVEKAIGKGWKEGKDLLNMSGETSKKLTYGDTNNYGVIHNKFQEAQQKMDNRIKNPTYGTNLKNKFLAEGQENPIQYLQQKDNEAASKGLKQWKFSKKAST